MSLFATLRFWLLATAIAIWMGAFFYVSQARAEGSSDYPFRFDTTRVQSDYELTAINDGPATITLVAKISGENIASDQNWPMVIVVPANSRRHLARVFAANAAKGYRFTTSYSYSFGDYSAVQDPGLAYRIPLADGTATLIGQAPGGHMTTHTDKTSKDAIDFTVPAGTPVVAARDGVVIDTQSQFSEGGKDPRLLNKANLIAIQHSDHSTAYYAHLEKGGVLVRRGQQVVQGQLIGYAGNTGYSNGPHLHFAVTHATVRSDGTVHQESIPVEFFNYEPPSRFMPAQNERLVANYSAPAPLPSSAAPPPAMAKTDPIPVTLENAGDVIQARPIPTQLERFEEAIGYPWWAMIAFCFGGLLIIQLLKAFVATFREDAALS